MPGITHDASSWDQHRWPTMGDIAEMEARLGRKLDLIYGLLQTVDKETKMAVTDVASAVAAIQAETSAINAIKAGEDALRGTAATIADEIAALKAQIAAGTPPDFTPLDQAIQANDAAISQVSSALQAAPATTSTGT